jgi:hypothetical protein
MSNHRMLETVAAELRRCGLPSAEVARLLQELADHVADLLAEQGGLMNEAMQVNERIESRLGRPEDLVAAALANRRQTSVFGRHPILSFVMAPIPLAILSWAGFFLLWIGLVQATGWILGENALRDLPALRDYLMMIMKVGMRFLAPAVAVVLLCWCAKRGGMSWRWTLAATCLVALLAGALVVQSTISTEARKGTITFGLGMPVLHWVNLIQLLVPLSVGTLFLWRARSHRLRATLYQST